MNDLINIEDFSFRYGKSQVLNHINFTIYEHEIIGLLGENGSGKTTFLDCLYGFHGAMQTIELFSTHPSLDNPSIKQNVSYIQDTPNLLDYVTAEQYIKFICQIEKIDYEVRLHEVQGMIDLFDLTNDYKRKLIKYYSFGMKKKIQLIGEFLLHRRLIMIDEPTNGLDVKMIIHLKELIKKEYEKRPTTFLISSHNINFLEDVCHRVCLFHHHEIVKTLVMSKDVDLETAFLDVIKGNGMDVYAHDY